MAKQNKKTVEKAPVSQKGASGKISVSELKKRDAATNPTRPQHKRSKLN